MKPGTPASLVSNVARPFQADHQFLGRALCCLCWAAYVAGCAGRTTGSDRFVPEAGTARAALEAALTAWQNGEMAAEIRAASTPVQVVDTHRQANQKLEQFEILGEVGGDTGRCFSVRLKLENAGEQQKARYIVVGVNPLWVFREEDFTMLTHWDHSMPDDANAKSP